MAKVIDIRRARDRRAGWSPGSRWVFGAVDGRVEIKIDPGPEHRFVLVYSIGPAEFRRVLERGRAALRAAERQSSKR